MGLHAPSGEQFAYDGRVDHGAAGGDFVEGREEFGDVADADFE